MTKILHPQQRKGHASTLIDSDVVRLRKLAAEGRLNVREAALFHQVGVETIRRAVRGDTFGHLGQQSEEDLAAAAKESLERFKAMQAKESARLAQGQEILKGLDNVGREPDAGYDDEK